MPRLGDFPTLESLSLEADQPEQTVGAFEKLTALRELQLVRTPPAPFLQALAKACAPLETAFLDGTVVHDVADLARFPLLRTVDLRYGRFTLSGLPERLDLAPLQALPIERLAVGVPEAKRLGVDEKLKAALARGVPQWSQGLAGSWLTALQREIETA